MRSWVSIGLTVAAALLLAAMPAFALDLNDYRRAHKLPPLQYSADLAAAAQWHANDLARRNRLDHRGFRRRIAVISSTAAENVSYGCESEDCAIRQWARSPGHRRNMLLKGVSRFGIASARSQRGRTYWVLVVGN